MSSHGRELRSPSPDTVNGTAVSASNDGTHWQHVGIVRGSVSSVTVHGATLVAVGSEPAAKQNARASIWTSRDGVTWRRAFAAPAARITSYTSVASNGRWLVAVGYRGRYEATTPGVMAISKDGIHWVAIHRDGGVFARHAYLESVTAVGQGFATLGTESSGDGTPSNPVRSHTVVFGSNMTPSRAATSTRTLHDGASTIRELEARPLRAPQAPHERGLPAGDRHQPHQRRRPCGRGRTTRGDHRQRSPGLQFGKAEPLRSKSGVSQGGWHGAKVLWLVRVEQPNPVIVRGTRIDGKGSVRWADNGTGAALALTSDATSTAPTRVARHPVRRDGAGDRAATPSRSTARTSSRPSSSAPNRVASDPYSSRDGVARQRATRASASPAASTSDAARGTRTPSGHGAGLARGRRPTAHVLAGARRPARCPTAGRAPRHGWDRARDGGTHGLHLRGPAAGFAVVFPDGAQRHVERRA